MAAEKRAEVTWLGDLMSGSGTIERVGSGAFGPLGVSWAARTGEGQAELTSPEEMIAAAHAAASRWHFPTDWPKPGRLRKA